ncbi:MAG: hypothetical protein HKM95_17890 [Inquilinus sp.]|nr:hypothetical protein [Inquilinus sp.]
MTLSRLGTIALLALVCGTLVACDYTYRRSFLRPSYRPTVFNYAAGGRDLKVETIGNPFSGVQLDDARVAELTTSAMQGHNLGQPTNLTPTPTDSARPQYKVVVAYNPIEPAGYLALCRGDVRAAPAGEPLRVKAVFCESVDSGPRVLTGVRGQLSEEQMAAPDSPAYRSLMAGVARELFPLWDSDMDDDRCRGAFFLCH